MLWRNAELARRRPFPQQGILTAGRHLLSLKPDRYRRAHPINDTASAHLHEESDPGPFLPIECQVYERRDAYQVKAGGRDVTARDSDRLDGLVDGASPNGMNLDMLLTPDDAGDRPGDRNRLGGGSNFQHLARRPALARSCYKTLVNCVVSRCAGSG